MACFIVEPIDWLPKFKPINMFNNLCYSPFSQDKTDESVTHLEWMIHQVWVRIIVVGVRETEEAGGGCRMYENDK